MPTSYRFEISPNNRAGCQNKDCKDAGLKITKGDLRFGTWVEYSMGEREFQGWKWRHWSCITPTVIQNLLKAVGGLEGIEDDLDVIDGFDEMPPEWQGKILTMLRDGHIPDEDWKGDVEQNRPGKRGSHKKAAASKKAAAGGDENDDAEETPTKAKATQRRGKKSQAKANDDDDDDDDDDDAEQASTKSKTTKGRGKKLKTEATGGGEDATAGSTPTKAKAPTGRGKRIKVEPDRDDEDSNVLRRARDSQIPRAPSNENKNQKKRKSGRPALTEADEDDDQMPEEKPTKKSAKKIKVENGSEGQTTKAKKNGQAVPASRVAENARRKKATAREKQTSDDLGETEPPGGREEEAVKAVKAVKAEQLDGPADLKAQAGGTTNPDGVTQPPTAGARGRPSKHVKKPRNAAKAEDADEDATSTADAVARSAPKTKEAAGAEGHPKPIARRGKARKDVKAERDDDDDDMDTLADVPAEAIQEAASTSAPEKAGQAKATASKKKGTAKGVAKRRTRPDY